MKSALGSSIQLSLFGQKNPQAESPGYLQEETLDSRGGCSDDAVGHHQHLRQGPWGNLFACSPPSSGMPAMEVADRAIVLLGPVFTTLFLYPSVDLANCFRIGVGTFFCKGLDSKYFKFCGPCGL